VCVTRRLEALLRVGFVAEDLDRLAAVVRGLSEERLARHPADVAANADPAVLVSMAETARA